jgi:hypothetical protein
MQYNDVGCGKDMRRQDTMRDMIDNDAEEKTHQEESQPVSPRSKLMETTQDCK